MINIKTLKIIKISTDLAGTLILLAFLLIIIRFITMPERSLFDIGEPHWKIESPELKMEIEPVLPVSDSQVSLHTNTLQMSLPVHLPLRITVIVSVLIFAVFIGYLLEIIKQIIRDVRNQRPFSSENIRRVKWFGMLVTTAPLIEWTMLGIVSAWIENYTYFEGLRLAADSILGWPVLVLGLLIIVLGISFEQGKKLQEENELTI